MKYSVFWSEFSERKLDEIFDYYQSRASYKIARKLITEIISGTVILETNPLAGPIEPLLMDRKEEYHYLVCGNYKVIYSVDQINRLVKIADVFDTRQNPMKIGR
jgi:plasmid stabilization system protein ParE